MLLFNTRRGPVVRVDDKVVAIGGAWDALVARDDLARWLADHVAKGPAAPLAGAGAGDFDAELLAPIGSQEVWACGVTYFRSRDARMQEARDAGGGDFYDRVYAADRPELFFKATPHRVVGHGQPVRIRRDAKWNVPEPELTLLVTPNAKIIGYTIGNDMSSRDIEGQNPLYLPQAKTYNQCCALGPGVLVTDEPLPRSTPITLTIMRGGAVAFTGSTDLSQLKRELPALVDWAYRDNSFPAGCLLLTGTGVVPPDDFTLQPGDEVRITIDPIGTLVNRVVQG